MPARGQVFLLGQAVSKLLGNLATVVAYIEARFLLLSALRLADEPLPEAEVFLNIFALAVLGWRPRGASPYSAVDPNSCFLDQIVIGHVYSFALLVTQPLVVDCRLAGSRFLFFLGTALVWRCFIVLKFRVYLWRIKLHLFH